MAQSSEIKLLKRFDQDVEITGDLTLGGNFNYSSGLVITGTIGDTYDSQIHIIEDSPTIRLEDTGSNDDFWIHVNSNNFYVLTDRGGDGTFETPHPLQLEADTNTGYVFGNVIINSGNIGSYALTSLPSHTHDYLHSSPSQLASTDLNTLTTSGVYFSNTSYSSNSNYPYANYFTLLNIMNNDRQAQIWMGDTPGRMYWRAKQGNTTGWHPWENVITSNNIGSQSVSYASSAGNADTLDGYHASSFLTSLPSHNHDDRYYTESESDSRFTSKDHFRSTGTGYYTSTTTSALLTEALGDGAFNSYLTAHKTGWSYAGNGDLTDAGRLTELAGTSWLWWTDNSTDGEYGNITGLCIAPNTGGSANKAFIYNNQGSGYAPGWREIWTSASDGSGSGLDADLLDGLQGSSYLRSDASDTFSGDYLGFSGLSLGIANNNSTNGYNTYFRGNSTHFVLGLTNGNTLYLNYGNSSGELRTYGTFHHENTVWMDTSRNITVPTANVGGILLEDSSDRGGLLEINRKGSSSWGGIQIAGYSKRWSWMGNSANIGAYDDTSGKWIWLAYADAGIDLYYNNGVELQTKSGYLLATNQMRSPIFYDSNDTGYYCNPASTSNFNVLAMTGRFEPDDPDGYVSSTITGLTNAPIYYPESNVGTSNVYVPHTHSRTRYSSGYRAHISTGVHALASSWNYRYYIAQGGNDSYPTKALEFDVYNNNIYHSDGYIRIDGSTRSPIFYDSDNTSYYINPAGLSYVNEIRSNEAQANPRWDTAFYVVQAQHWYGDTSSQTMYVGESGNDVIIRGQVAIGGTAIQSGYALTMTGHVDMNAYDINYVSQLHFNDNVRFYDAGNDSYLNFKFGDSNEGAIRFYDGAGAQRGWLYTDTSGFGLLSADGSWAFRSTNGGNEIYHDVKCPIYYDSDNTGYYLNAASTSRLNQVDANYLDVVASAAYALRFWSGSNNYSIRMSESSNTTYGGRMGGETTSDYNMYFTMAAGTNRGFVFNNGLANAVAGIDASGNGRFKGDVVAYSGSDKRLKDNIKTIENPIDKVQKISGVEFDWNENQTTYEAGTHDIGVIAQEIEEVLPDIVTTRDTGYKAVKYEKIVPLLIEAIKEQQKQIEELKSLINKS